MLNESDDSSGVYLPFNSVSNEWTTSLINVLISSYLLSVLTVDEIVCCVRLNNGPFLRQTLMS